jgi:hypothetical protein
MLVDFVHQDNASYESGAPEILRNRLHIRVLTMVDQIVAWKNYEWQALELLKKLSYGHIKMFDPLFLVKMGLKLDPD